LEKPVVKVSKKTSAQKKLMKLWSSASRKWYNSVIILERVPVSVVDPNSFLTDSDSDPRIIFFGFGYGFEFLD
jgi:hypothetical protein